MSFVNCLMPDEDKGKIDFPVYTEKDGRRPTLYKWTVDAERNAFLVLADIEGGPHADTDQEFRFILACKAFRIRFWAKKDSMSKIDTGNFVSWRVYGVDIPEGISEEQVRSLITDALMAFGAYWNGERCRVTVEFC
ncbi:hypothetical protein NGA35_06340 [Pseudomonas stutzeri]|nr:hypothetical protein [Stutzerimonas stutzeri]